MELHVCVSPLLTEIWLFSSFILIILSLLSLTSASTYSRGVVPLIYHPRLLESVSPPATQFPARVNPNQPTFEPFLTIFSSLATNAPDNCNAKTLHVA